MRTFLVFLGLFLGAKAASRLENLDMVFAIDDSSRLREFHRDRNNQLFRSITTLIDRVYTDVHSPRLGLVLFNDKPLLHYMPHPKIKENYCSRLMRPLGSDRSKFMRQLDQVNFKGQASDYKTETDSYAGIMKAFDPRMRWRGSSEKRPVTRLIVLIAGAEPCTINKGIFNHYTPLKTWTNDGDLNYKCLDEDYYSRSMVLDALREKNALLYVFTWYGYFQPYRDLVALLGRGRVYTLIQDFDQVATQLISTDGVHWSPYESVQELPADSAPQDDFEDDPNLPEEPVKVTEEYLRIPFTWDNFWRDMYSL